MDDTRRREVEEIERRHRKIDEPAVLPSNIGPGLPVYSWCLACRTQWPCDVALLLTRLRRVEGETWRAAAALHRELIADGCGPNIIARQFERRAHEAERQQTVIPHDVATCPFSAENCDYSHDAEGRG